MTHGMPSGTSYDATFAFKLAKEEAKKRGVNVNRPRRQLERDPVFSAIYSREKGRVSRMSVRAIEINGPVLQALFEIYASMSLQTMKYNDFDTH